MASVDIPDIEYDHWCHKCSGEGKIFIAGQGFVQCELCEGRGYYTTTEGDKLLLFLEHQGFVRREV